MRLIEVHVCNALAPPSPPTPPPRPPLAPHAPPEAPESPSERFLRLSVVDPLRLGERRRASEAAFYGQFTYTPAINEVEGQFQRLLCYRHILHAHSSPTLSHFLSLSNYPSAGS